MRLPKKRRILAIGDLHEPFTLPDYLPFCKAMYNKHKCNVVIFLGDLVDNHYSSFHETDPDGHSAAVEFELAYNNIQKWYKTFPDALVTIGNHDSVPNRRAFNAGMSKTWVKKISEVLDVPRWEFDEQFLIDGVMYCHGIGRVAHTRMQSDIVSVVQGHYHTDSSIRFLDGAFSNLFSMQVGCGFDRSSYAAAYAKSFKHQAHNVGVILDNGRLPIIERM